jgi:hypothetical protein
MVNLFKNNNIFNNIKIMGIYCSFKDMEGRIKCWKCSDRYKPSYGGLSNRNSCRYHVFKSYGNATICTDCHLDKKSIGCTNCYHSPYK